MGQSLTHVINAVEETRFVTGNTYRFKVAAVNAIGEGPQSNAIYVALAKPVSLPSTPTIDRSRSTRTSIWLTWTEGDAGDIPVLGFKVFQIYQGTGDSSMVYDGSLNPLTK